MGSFSRVNYFVNALEEVKAQFPDVQLVSTTLEGESLYNFENEKPIFVLIGSESHGLSEEAKMMSTTKLKIPAHPKTKAESLNAGVATSIILSYLYGKSLD
jgi:TrmH family RNA methyltransferase